jgi:hypothetical protein
LKLKKKWKTCNRERKNGEETAEEEEKEEEEEEEEEEEKRKRRKEAAAPAAAVAAAEEEDKGENKTRLFFPPRHLSSFPPLIPGSFISCSSSSSPSFLHVLRLLPAIIFCTPIY